MDEGFPIAYQVLEKDVPVYASGGEQVGTVDHVVAAPDQDIFHGIVMRSEHKSQHFIEAEQIASLHELGVDLRIDEATARALPQPHGAAPIYHDSEPGIKPSKWKHLVKKAEGRGRLDDWTKDK
jgi:hypothetical protein